MAEDFIIAVLLPLKYFPYARAGSLAYFVPLSLSSPVDIIHLHELLCSCTVLSMDTDSNQPPTTIRGIVGGREKWNGLP